MLVSRSKSDESPKLASTVAASLPAASTMVVRAETYLESLDAIKVTVTASPVKVSMPPSATIFTPLLSDTSKEYCPEELVVVVAKIFPSTSNNLTVEPLTYPSTTVPETVSASARSLTVKLKACEYVLESESVAVTVTE